MTAKLVSDVVRLRLAGGETISGHVLSQGGDAVVLAFAVAGPDIGSPVQVALDTDAGLQWRSGLVAARVDRPRPALRVELLGEPVTLERRHAPRALTDLEVQLAPAGDDLVAGRLLEVSRDSLRVATDLRLLPGDLVQLVVHLPGESPLRLTAQVVRRVGEQEAALVFELVPVERRDRLVRNAFARLLDAA